MVLIFAHFAGWKLGTVVVRNVRGVFNHFAGTKLERSWNVERWTLNVEPTWPTMTMAISWPLMAAWRVSGNVCVYFACGVPVGQRASAPSACGAWARWSVKADWLEQTMVQVVQIEGRRTVTMTNGDPHPHVAHASSWPVASWAHPPELPPGSSSSHSMFWVFRIFPHFSAFFSSCYPDDQMTGSWPDSWRDNGLIGLIGLIGLMASWPHGSCLAGDDAGAGRRLVDCRWWCFIYFMSMQASDLIDQRWMFEYLVQFGSIWILNFSR